MTITNMFEEDAGVMQVQDDQIAGIAALGKRAKGLQREIEDLERVFKNAKSSFVNSPKKQSQKHWPASA